AEKRIEIALECAGLIPERIVTDPARFRQILTNLVGNAIKFTEAGGVKVRLRFEASRPIAGVQVEVIDSGIGIPGDKLETIFEPFTQAEGSITRRFGGTGLGLTISRSLARALGGDLAARNAPGGGSIFTLTLPAGPIEGVLVLTDAAGARGAYTIAATPGPVPPPLAASGSPLPLWQAALWAALGGLILNLMPCVFP
ncbi:MAG: ATP-binding protein, partial [Gammaproteobacteria bacterium]